MTSEKPVGAALLAAANRHLIDESLPRIVKCLGKLTEQEIWARPNTETVSVGNLVLHLCGNVRQHIIHGLGGAPDVRVRDEEFNETGPLPTEALAAKLEETMSEAAEVLREFDPACLLDPVRVQGRDEIPLTVITHVVEHFSYHAGEITYSVKSRKAIDMGYYADQNLNETG